MDFQVSPPVDPSASVQAPCAAAAPSGPDASPDAGLNRSVADKNGNAGTGALFP
jgi:hypothetical protein